MARDTTIPSFLIPQDGQAIKLQITGTDALLEEQGYTYNQAGFSYNQAGVAYGGVYNTNEDIIPIDITFSDIYTNTAPPVPNFNQSTAPGFFLFITHQ